MAMAHKSEIAPSPPPQTELVIGLVGAVGIDLDSFASELGSVLSGFDYRTHNLHLTDQLGALKWKQKLVNEPYDERVWSYMTAGNKLCKQWDRRDAFGLLAINAITLERKKLSGDDKIPVDRSAYVLRSLKRHEEIALLRQVYGPRFVQISIYAPEKTRRRYLKRKIRQSRVVPVDSRPVHRAKDLIRRDHSENKKYGQDVEGTFHHGDFFIDATADVEAQLQRTMEILFGHPNRTPTRDEFGMFQAVAASKRSAELGRQVGASICTSDGAVIAVGTNEVPRAGGGLYWEGDPDDAREFMLGEDMSDKRKERIVRGIFKRLRREGRLRKGVKKGKIKRDLKRTEIAHLIEYVRAVHAEMAALMDAARRGISVANTVLYATTFPCHHCARHIVASGIKRVVYVTPYPKSLADGLHDDSILVDPPHRKASRRRVAFEPFVGVGPRRYLELFDMPKRKRDGKPIKFKPRDAVPRVADIEPGELRTHELPYVRREERALSLLGETQGDRGPRLKGFTLPKSKNNKKKKKKKKN
jgi:deoxycytidylate deaminase